MNPFDAVVYFCLFVAVVMGFHAGLLRSLATIFGYLAAMAIAIGAAPKLSLLLAEQLGLADLQEWVVLGAIFVVGGLVLGALLRLAVSELVGERVSLPDRVAGALLGAVRIGLLATLMVVIFERIIPPGREPAFLRDSHLRPLLSAAGQQGLKSLPPDVESYIDDLKKLHGI
ncbi:MAG TPA: CvpA family protein [Xanthobacteraceae bacterium]|jgi:membrane protein required for colicin V production|nr:CvpA family protein [Xanthobacteraceae bacterium]